MIKLQLNHLHLDIYVINLLFYLLSIFLFFFLWIEIFNGIRDRILNRLLTNYIVNLGTVKKAMRMAGSLQI